MATKKDKVISLFQSKFQVTNYHKPTMNPGDEFYYISIETLIRIKIRSHVGNVLVIEEIIPLSMKYVKEFDNDFVELLMNNKQFTVLISCIGYTGNIGKLCRNKGIDIVEESRLVTYPKPFYDRIKSTQNVKLNQYGFYLLAVADDSFIEEIDKKRGFEEVIDVIKKTYLVQTKDDKFNIGAVLDTNIIVDSENVIFEKMGKISHPNPFMWYIRFTEILEEISSMGYNVYLKDISDNTLYNVCNNRGYGLVKKTPEMSTIFGKISGGGLGTFNVKKN